MRGKFITFEGIDGCGKTTQLRLLEPRLAGLGINFISTCEPGGTDIGSAIRRILLDSKNFSLVPLAELLLYAADRAQHAQELILPKLESGVTVLSDRYTDATVAFQGYGRGFDLDLINNLNRLAAGGLKPDLTILLDLEPEQAQLRARKRRAEGAPAEDESRLDNEAIDFHRRVRRGYLELARQEPERIKLIPAEGTIEAVSELVISEVMKLFQR